MQDASGSGRNWNSADLLGGEDETFVNILYLALLRRWPDPGGYERYLTRIAGRPEQRIEVVREIAASDEAVRAGVHVVFGAGPTLPPAPHRSLAVGFAVLAEWLRGAMAGQQAESASLRDALAATGPGVPVAELIEGRDAALHAAINELRREVMERFAALGGPAGTAAAEAWEAATAALSRLVADRSADQAAALRAEFEQRFRDQDARILALEARPRA